MSVYEYRGDPGMGYLRLACAHGTAPVTGLQVGDLVDFGEHQPPADGRWIDAPEGATATKLPDNHPDNQPVVHWPEPEPDDTEPGASSPSEDAKPTEAEPAPADSAPAEPAKRSKPAAKNTAA